MFKDLTPEHFDKLGSALFNTGNLTLGGLLFTQVTADKPFDLRIAIAGIFAWAWFFIQALIFMQVGVRRRKEKEKVKRS